MTYKYITLKHIFDQIIGGVLIVATVLHHLGVLKLKDAIIHGLQNYQNQLLSSQHISAPCPAMPRNALLNITGTSITCITLRCNTSYLSSVNCIVCMCSSLTTVELQHCIASVWLAAPYITLQYTTTTPILPYTDIRCNALQCTVPHRNTTRCHI